MSLNPSFGSLKGNPMQAMEDPEAESICSSVEGRWVYFQAHCKQYEKKYSFEVTRLENSSLELQTTQCTSFKLGPHFLIYRSLVFTFIT